MKLFNTKGFLIAVLSASIFFSCSKEKTFNPLYLVDYTVVKTYTKQDMINMAGSGGLFPPAAASFIQFGIKAIRITYNTVGVNNEAVVASGALLVPETTFQLPMLSFQHGTLSSPSEAPSLFQSAYTEQLAIFAATGYNVALPDYLGYGSTVNLYHPYEHRSSLATATRDMLRASYEYFKVTGLRDPEDRLFLSGYSEGGFATMAAVKLMQEEHRNEFKITAATVGAGAYNKTETAKWVVGANEKLEYINSFVWVLDVYNKIYPQLQRPFQAIFNEPWATVIAQQGVFAPIEQNPALLLRPEFISGVLNGTDTRMMAALADNDCYNWKPEFPIKLYHGTNDRWVPYLNSETAYQAMTALGTKNIELITIDGGTHETALAPYIFGTFVFFLSVQGKETTLAGHIPSQVKFGNK